MAISKEVLRQLVALQEQDGNLDKLQAAADKVRKDIEAVKAEVEREKGSLSEIKNRVITLEKQKKEKELELAQRDEIIRKHSLELNQVKTNEAFKALQNQIDQAKADANILETAILEIMMGLDGCRQDEKTLASQLKVGEEKAQAQIRAHESRLGELQAQEDGAKKQREEMVAVVGADVLKIYQHIRSRGKLNAVVAVEREHCGACQVALSPQVIVELTKLKQLIICESCQRIIYKTETLVDKVQAPASA